MQQCAQGVCDVAAATLYKATRKNHRLGSGSSLRVHLFSTMASVQPLLLLLLAALLSLASAAGGAWPFSLGIRDSIMIAHSFKGEQFGPAQKMHGATYTVDVTFRCKALVPKCNWVVDIGEASEALGKILGRYNFRNLDEVFPEENTTTEFMCKVIHADLVKHFCTERPKGKERFKGAICVKLWESHKAWACYEANV